MPFGCSLFPILNLHAHITLIKMHMHVMARRASKQFFFAFSFLFLLNNLNAFALLYDLLGHVLVIVAEREGKQTEYSRGFEKFNFFCENNRLS